MMRLISILSFLFLSLISEAQSIKGVVVDDQDLSGLPFVNITVNGSRVGTASDIDGKFILPKVAGGVQYIELSYVGYEKKRVDNPGNGIVIKMTEMTSQLKEVTVMPGVNPAHRIIENTVDNRKRHNPNELHSFSYKSYSKFVLSLNTDSADASIDSVFVDREDTSYVKLDSFDYKTIQFVERQHLFFMESVTERNFLAPSRDNERVLASRTSGFKNPMFSLFSSQMQSFSFYENYIAILGKEYLNPITPGSTSRYFFVLEDTAYNDPTDTVYIISFRPQPNSGFEPMQGLLYINAKDWAIQNVIARPFEESDLEITIEQRYEKFGNETWFPVQLNAEMNFASLTVNDINPYGKIRTYLKGVRINPELRAKNISRADISINDDAVKNADSILPQFRTDSLSSQESTTYQFMDSLSEAENIEAKLFILNSIARGYIPWGPFDFGLDQTIRYNQYEGLRLGGNIFTNQKVSKWFKIGGYFGYGFGDERLKWGWNTEMTLDKNSNFKIKGGYQFDIFESGGIEFLQRKNYGLSVNAYRFLKIQQWDEASRYFAGFTYDLRPKTHLEVKFQRENRYTIGGYYYEFESSEGTVFQNGFNYSEVITSLRHAPNEKYIEGAGLGRFAYQLDYPIYYIQYTRGIEGLLGSDFTYNKLDILYENQFPTLWLGTITIIAQAGIVNSALPYAKLYTNMANMTNNEQAFFRNLAIADRHSFETMRINEFLSDRYFQFLYRQDLKSLLFKRKQFAPHIEFITRVAWGDLDEPEKHFNLPTKTMDKGFYESGVELNNLLSNKLGSIKASVGVGTYYRYGPNSLVGFENNFAFKITSKIIY